MIGRTNVGYHKHCYRLISHGFRDFIFIISLYQILTLPGRGQFGPQGHVGKIYDGNYQILQHTKYRSSGLCVFGENVFFFLQIVFQLQVYERYLLPWKPQV